MSVFHNNALIGASGQGAAAGAGYEIERSLRFNSADSAYLNRTPSSAGNQKTWTWSGWVKRSSFGTSQYFFGNYYNSANDGTSFRFTTSDQINIFDLTSGSFAYQLTSTQVFRDPSAWYHFVIALDTTQATAADRLKVYVNGSEITVWTTSTYPSQNTDYDINNTQLHTIGRSGSYAGQYFDGYLADVHFIDGQALDPTDFGEFDATTGAWNPIAYSGSFPGNSFHLDFSDNSSASALGTDSSGNSNDWTVNNLQATGAVVGQLYKSTTLYTTRQDVISNATAISGGSALSGSDYLYIVPDGSETVGTAVFSSAGSVTNADSLNRFEFLYYSGGTWNQTSGGYNNADWVDFDWGSVSSNYQLDPQYFYTLSAFNQTPSVQGGTAPTLNTIGTDAGNDSLFDSPTNGTQTDTGAGGEVSGNYATLNPLVKKTYGATLANGNLQISVPTTGHSRSTIGISSGKWYAEYTHGTGLGMCGVADGDTNTDYYLGQNSGGNGYGYYSTGTTYSDGAGGVAYGASYTTGDVIGIAFDADNGTLVFYKNGSSQGTAFTGLTSGPYFFAAGVDTMANSHMNFGQRPYAYTAPSGYKAFCTANLDDPTIADGSTAMDVGLYTGTGSSSAIAVNGVADPDFVWIKSRSVASSHALYDIIRGWNERLYSNATNSEYTYGSDILAPTSTGLNITTTDADHNTSSATYVAWTWDAGASTVANTDGSISSSVRANPSAGFSIVSYTGAKTTTTADTVGHGLNIEPALLIVKDRGENRGWLVYHKYNTYQNANPNTNALELSLTTQSYYNNSYPWGSTTPTSSVFTINNLGSNSYYNLNQSGKNYIAYCWAPVEGYSAFGSYTGNNQSTDGPFVYTGFRPRVIITKAVNTSTQWGIWDADRVPYNETGGTLYPSLPNAEEAASTYPIDFLSNGFKIRHNAGFTNSTNTIIYMAWAENPFKYARAR